MERLDIHIAGLVLLYAVRHGLISVDRADRRRHGDPHPENGRVGVVDVVTAGIHVSHSLPASGRNPPYAVRSLEQRCRHTLLRRGTAVGRCKTWVLMRLLPTTVTSFQHGCSYDQLARWRAIRLCEIFLQHWPR
jgi:hypothetical protein